MDYMFLLSVSFSQLAVTTQPGVSISSACEWVLVREIWWCAVLVWDYGSSRDCASFRERMKLCGLKREDGSENGDVTYGAGLWVGAARAYFNLGAFRRKLRRAIFVRLHGTSIALDSTFVHVGWVGQVPARLCHFSFWLFGRSYRSYCFADHSNGYIGCIVPLALV